jgi:hypothetical protein
MASADDKPRRLVSASPDPDEPPGLVAGLSLT